MVAQRGQRRSGAHRREGGEAEERRQSRPPPAPAPAKRKLTFNEQHDLKTLPRRMAEIEAKIAKLQEILADPELYARDPARFQKAMAALTALQAELPRRRSAGSSWRCCARSWRGRVLKARTSRMGRFQLNS